MVVSQMRKQVLILTIMMIFTLVLIILNLSIGTLMIHPIHSLQTLMGFGSEEQSILIFDFRLPRAIVAIAVGMALSTSGAILQALARNPLADPGIIGINAGAGLGVVLFVYFFFGQIDVTSYASVFVLPLFAFVGALVAATIIYLLAWKDGVTATRLILVGIAVAAGFSAINIVFSMKMTANDFRFATVWLSGSLWGTDWKFVLAALPWLIILLPLAYAKSNLLNVLNLGDKMATGLGVAVERERRKLLFISVALAGVSVAVAGGIGFIGLLAPHIARRMVGAKHQIMLPVSALIGAILLLTADCLARSLMPSSEIPVGLVLSLIGAPYFIYLLIKTP
ncbi:FecCD family ABC transporter permease [Bacillus sp. FJAT-42315]|uniref:FecCD family ABC transporter permease n=1 Tax=Bacillus sp. FJAT-42315 TaxID=2014077 RepID=UPI000C24F916|nr:iron ABC transporter permease [Bacillus sp. FJAT-42315]